MNLTCIWLYHHQWYINPLIHPHLYWSIKLWWNVWRFSAVCLYLFWNWRDPIVKKVRDRISFTDWIVPQFCSFFHFSTPHIVVFVNSISWSARWWLVWVESCHCSFHYCVVCILVSDCNNIYKYNKMKKRCLRYMK